MDEIKVCNLRNEKVIYPYDVRVDRSSILGNPYFMHKESERDLVCDKYEEYFNDRFKTDKAFKKEVLRLVLIYNRYGKLRLFCWCYPKRCHAMYIKTVIEKLIRDVEIEE